MARVVVVGGGIAGTAVAARLAKLRHDVVLLERLDRLGLASSKADEGPQVERRGPGWAEIPSSAPADDPLPGPA